MPAVTVDDILSLPRLATPEAGATTRPVVSVTDAPSGFEGEGFPVRRAFAGVDLAQLDPFVHMDQMGEVEYGPGEPRGTAWHPHRGFETVTYMIDGTFQHQDSTGGGGLITNGDTQWMTAGAGILHIERPPEALVTSGGLFHGVQLWVNLPSRDKFVAPRYQDIRAGQVALVSSPDGGALVRVIAGELDGHAGPGVTHTPMAMAHVTVSPGRAWSCRGPAPSTPSFTCWRARGRWATTSAPCAPVSWRCSGPVTRWCSAPRPRRRRARRARGVGARRPSHRRAGGDLRPVRHEHEGRDRPGPRGLPGRAAGHGARRPHRLRMVRPPLSGRAGDD